jgi:hypothetical protein
VLFIINIIFLMLSLFPVLLKCRKSRLSEAQDNENIVNYLLFLLMNTLCIVCTLQCQPSGRGRHRGYEGGGEGWRGWGEGWRGGGGLWPELTNEDKSYGISPPTHNTIYSL